jgi:hypothetical protein
MFNKGIERNAVSKIWQGEVLLAVIQMVVFGQTHL